MGKIISLFILILGALYYFVMRLTGNRKVAEEDDIAGGAAWIVTLIASLFFFMFFVFPYVTPIINKFENPLKTILQLLIGGGCIYVSYKIACMVAPAKDQRRQDQNLK